MSRPSLGSLTLEYFKRRGYSIEKSMADSNSSSISNFDFLVKRFNNVHPVRIKDWNRTVGVNIVIRLDKAADKKIFSKPILVAEKFSEHARSYAARRGLILITRSEIVRDLG